MNSRRQAKNLLKSYLAWPIFFVVIALATFALIFFMPEKSFAIAGIALAIAVLAALIIYLSYRITLTKALVRFAMEMGEEELEKAKLLDVPYALIEENGKIAWANEAFSKAISNFEEKATIEEIFGEIDEEVLSEIEDRRTLHLTYREKTFDVVICDMEIEDNKLFAVYLYDATKLAKIEKKYQDDKPIVGLIYLDNYEEAMESVDEVKRSLLTALVDRKIGKYITDIDGVIKKLEKDKYLFLIKNMYLPQLENTRFDILEDVKTVNIGNNMAVTISIGMGLSGETFADNYSYARTAIDMALARGGDQAVIKDYDAIRYYGGKSQSIEKSTRVKARVKAQAFTEILGSNENVVVMGHTLMDIDCLGAAVGVWRIATTLGKKAHIIIGEAPSQIKYMVDRFKESSDYPKDMFITKAQAMDVVSGSTVLTVVDVNRPVITEAPELLDVANTVVVFDHHRQGSDNISQAVLSYVEPYASSACEMVAEIIQYIEEEIKLKAVEADSMYAGIVIDTHNFTNQTGVRTFEAAAYLRKCGADVTRVRKIFRDSVEDYRAKADAIHSAEIFMGAYAITECNGEGLESPTIVGAQAANELLDIEGIKASFVLTVFRDKVYISARSIDEVNVQVLMEKIGGGGHRSIAGAQMKDVSVDDAKRVVKDLIMDEVKRRSADK